METFGSWPESSYSRSNLCFRGGGLRHGMALQDFGRRLGFEEWSSSISEEDETRTIDNRNEKTRFLVVVCLGRVFECNCRSSQTP